MSRLTVDWLWLLALTAAGFWLAEHRAPVPATWLGLAGVTLLKGRWIIDRFMGLQTAVPWLRWTVLGWLVVVLLGLMGIVSRSAA